MCINRKKPFIAEPAPASSTSVSAICRAISALWALRPRTLPATRRVFDTMIWPTCVRDKCIAGHSPNSSAVAAATTPLKTSTGRLMRITTSGANANLGSTALMTARMP